MTGSDEDRSWEEVSGALQRGELPGGPPDEVHETHISVVAVIGDAVYKLKKPVRVGPVDYTTRERRLAMCLREIEVNARLGAPLYDRVVGVRRGSAGLELCVAGDPAALEHLVVMRYVPHEQMLHVRVDRRDENPEDLRRLGRLLGDFHATAPVAKAPAGRPEVVATWIQALIDRLRASGGSILSTPRLDALDAFFDLWLERHRGALTQRARDGWIREVHGDLRLEHVVLGDPLMVMDGVEFDDALRTVDVLSDLAFLVMELQLQQREDLTRILLDGWTGSCGPLDERLLWMYATARALVRAAIHVERLHEVPGGPPKGVAADIAQSLVALAGRLSWRARPPRAIVFAGLSGSGKSSLSSELARVWGLERWASDETRKGLIGYGRNQIAPSGAYDDQMSRDVYLRLGREAGREVAAGRSVVVDATFRRRDDAQAFVRAFRGAGGTGAPVVVGCFADEETLRRRLAERVDRHWSDATEEVLERQLGAGGVRQWGISGVHELDTSAGKDETVLSAEALVLRETV